MSRRKREDYAVRSLNKISNGKSYSITLPVEVIRAFRWQKKQKLTLTIDKKSKKIVIEDWEK
ncbi:MAG: AbrB/MazE/SpoVT family DNA-binding domain-containing protein [Candidatus Paceibacterota bacterium]